MSFGSAPSPPTPASPAEQGAAQTASNKQTDLYNFGLSNPNVNTPYGYDSYSVDTTTNPDKPIVTQNLNFSPTQQALYDQSTANQTKQGQIAGTALQGVNKQFNTPYDLNSAVGGMTASQKNLGQDYNNQYDALMKQQTAYLDPQYQNQQKQLDASLANQGIVPGSEAYKNAQEEQASNRTFAYQQAMDQSQAGAGSEQSRLANLGLANQAQAAQLYTQQYQQPLNLYNSLETGTQATLPQFQGTSQTNTAPPNILGAYANNYQGQLNAYNSKVGSQNSALGGGLGILGSLGSAAIMSPTFSDIRLKTAIKKLGKTKSHNLYEFEYIGSDDKHIGVMAQEVPDAAFIMPNGFLAVDYSKLGVQFA
jgi:hypothetical protein